MGTENVITPIRGNPVCVDMGHAVKLDYVYGPFPLIKAVDPNDGREDTPGVAQWRRMQKDFSQYFLKMKEFEHSVFVVKSLLFLNYHRPDLTYIDFLKDKKNAAIFANAYDYELYHPEETARYIQDLLADLATQIPVTTNISLNEEATVDNKTKSPTQTKKEASAETTTKANLGFFSTENALSETANSIEKENATNRTREEADDLSLNEKNRI